MAPGPRLYDTLLEPLVRNFRAAGLELTDPQSGSSVLDVGCGTGTNLALYEARGCIVTGVDLNPRMLKRASKRLGPSAVLVPADATYLPFEDDGFDLAVTMLMLHEMAPLDREAALEEMARVASRLLVVDYHPDHDGSLRGRMIRRLASGIERIAGGEHYRNYRQFLDSGGIPVLAEEAQMDLVASRREGSGTMGVYLFATAKG